MKEEKRRRKKSMHITAPFKSVVKQQQRLQKSVSLVCRSVPGNLKKTKQKQQEDVYLQFLSTSIVAVGRIARFLSPPRDVYTYVSAIGGEECRFFVRSRMLFFLSLEFSFTLAPLPVRLVTVLQQSAMQHSLSL